jgi:hypothetical protein
MLHSNLDANDGEYLAFVLSPYFANLSVAPGDIRPINYDTPGRYHKGTKQFIQAYDDRYILDMAKAEDGIVISNDQFRDLYDEFKDVINWRLLPFVMTADRIMIHTQDLPLSQDQRRVTLEQFIKK